LSVLLGIAKFDFFSSQPASKEEEEQQQAAASSSKEAAAKHQSASRAASGWTAGLAVIENYRQCLIASVHSYSFELSP
jgi:hypothetical protein